MTFIDGMILLLAVLAVGIAVLVKVRTAKCGCCSKCQGCHKANKKRKGD